MQRARVERKGRGGKGGDGRRARKEDRGKGESGRRKMKRERWGGRIGLKFSDNETSPVIVPAVINGVPLYSGSPCPWESKR